MKIAIITMISNNYGNRLQNYALQESLSKVGGCVETLHNPWLESHNEILYRIKRCVRRLLAVTDKKKKNVIRELSFAKFNKKYIKFSPLWLNKNKDRQRAAELYDLFICGSDQVWNSHAKEISGKYFADFASNHQKASYAASFGTDNICENRREEFQKYLSGFNHISVREKSGVKIVKELTDINAEQHMDPTVLLDKDDWEKIEKKPKRISLNSNYLVAYILGEDNSNMEAVISKISQKYNLEIIRLGEVCNPNAEIFSPDEFVYLLHHAKCVVTDSFHGTVFSIIFHTPFFTFGRKGVEGGMSTRLKSLVEILGLEKRFNPKMEQCNLEENIDFDDVDKTIEVERKRSFDYLNSILGEKTV